MNSSRFKKYQLKELCTLLKTSPQIVYEVTSAPEKYYKEWEEIKVDKTGKPKVYKDGTIKKRKISPPLEPLYSIQSKIKDLVFTPITLPPNIHGGVKRRTNISNAKPHQGNKFIFTTDLQDFFPSISNKQVNECLLSLGLSDHKAHWLSKLITFRYKVPQGSPTSSHIANLVFLKIDLALIALCEVNSIVYTRYVDDLTFSSQRDFRPLLNELLKVIIEGGFNISYRKTKYSGIQIITGINVFNNYIDAPKRIKDAAKAELTSDNPSKPFTHYVNRIKATNAK
jgi:RNA-directed DNA polymerase